MKVKFFLNFIPLGDQWYEDNNIPDGDVYCTGTLDTARYIHCSDELPIIHEESWNLLEGWLPSLDIDYLPTIDEVFKMFEESTGNKVKIYEGGD